MRLLLDTHALIWWMTSSERLPRRTWREIAAEANDVFVSPVSAFEISHKHGIGKLPLAEELLDCYEASVADQGFIELAIGTDHALAAGRLPPLHRDPFDRLLIAQAKIESLTLVSNEKLFDSYGVPRLWS